MTWRPVIAALALAACGRGKTPAPQPFEGAPPGAIDGQRVGAPVWSLHGIVWADDGERVYYTSRHEEGAPRRLFSADLVGGAPTPISDEETDVASFQVATNDAVAFLGRPPAATANNLHAASEGGPIELATGVAAFFLTDDGERVVFRAADHLFVVPVAGGPPVDITPADMTADGRVYGAAVIPGAPNTVLCTYMVASQYRRVLAAVDLDTGTAVRLNAPSSSGMGVSRAVPFAGNTRILYSEDRGNDDELYVVNIDGTGRQRIDDGTGDVQSFILAADEDTVVYTTSSVQTYRLLVVSLAAPTPRELAVNSDDWQWLGLGGLAANDSHVVYAVTDERHQVTELFSVPTAGGTAVRLNDPLPFGGTVGDIYYLIAYLSIHDRLVLYRATQDSTEHTELYVADVTVGTPVRVNPELPPGGNVLQAQFADGSVVYVAGAEVGWKQELFLWTDGESRRLSPPLPATADVSIFTISPSADRVLFQVVDTDTSALFLVSLD